MSPRPNVVLRFLRLTAAERRVLFLSAGALCAAPVLMRVAGFNRVVRALVRARTPQAADSRLPPARIGALVHACARRLPFRASCLDRSVTIAWLLKRHGHPCDLVIEVPPGNIRFTSHAWVDTEDGRIDEGRPRPGTELARWVIPASR